MLAKNLAGSLHKEKRDILIMSYLSSLEFEGPFWSHKLLTPMMSVFRSLAGTKKVWKRGRRVGGWGEHKEAKWPQTRQREDTVSATLSPLNFVQEERIIEWRVSRTLPYGENGNIWGTRENVLKNKLLRNTIPTAIIRQTHLILQSVSFRAHIHVIGKNTQGPKTKFCLKCRHQTRRRLSSRVRQRV